jgi:hypothetical protein
LQGGFLIPHEALRIEMLRAVRVMAHFDIVAHPWKAKNFRTWFSKLFLPVLHDVRALCDVRCAAPLRVVTWCDVACARETAPPQRRDDLLPRVQEAGSDGAAEAERRPQDAH